MRSKWVLALLLVPGLAGWSGAAFVARGSVWLWMIVVLALVWTAVVGVQWLRDIVRPVDGVIAHATDREELL